MPPEETFTVKVYISHFASYGVIYCPSSYPPEVGKLLDDDPLAWRSENGTVKFKGGRPSFMNYELPRPLPASTTMRQLKMVMEEEYKIPVSIQHHFRTDSVNEEKPWLPGAEFDDETTLRQAWEADTFEREEGKVLLVVDTTAKFLNSLSPFKKLTQLRNLWASQKYLRNKISKHEDSGNEAVSGWTAQLQTLEPLEKQYTTDLLRQVSTWNHLVYGEEERKDEFDWLENKSLEDRMWNIESHVYQWAKQNDRYLQRELGEEYGELTPTVLTTKQASTPQGENWKAEMENEQMEFHFPVTQEGSERVFARDLRYSSGELDPDSSSFDIRSGVLLWGQLHSIYNGSKSQGFLGNAEHVPDMLEGGTIKQWPLGPFRCAAQNGAWNVRKVFGSHWTSPTIGVNWMYPRASLDRHIGWIMFHEDYDPVDIIERCSRIGEYSGSSLGNRHIDRDVLFVNRYDWFYQRKNEDNDPDLRELIRQSTGATRKVPDDPDFPEFCDAEYLNYRGMQHFCAIDAEEFSPEFVTSYVRDCPQGEEVERIFSREGDGQGTKRKFGTYVTSVWTEYEFAWLVFSGKKHSKFTEEDELIAIVYDSVYDLLEGDRFAVEPEPGQVIETPGAQGLRWNLPFFQHHEESGHGGIEEQEPMHYTPA
ncbi:hypothetical protein FQN54_006712 [Arachnomyces sp. PD_36]|nr:hypothetical protein FQN54_006712 [Arachnomyces sp. PD_36]